jgi:hypothetical protein
VKPLYADLRGKQEKGATVMDELNKQRQVLQKPELQVNHTNQHSNNIKNNTNPNPLLMHAVEHQS